MGYKEINAKEVRTIQLNITTDYAIRIVFYLATKNEVVSSKELSENTIITQNMVLKIGRKLQEAGIVKVVSGVQGGFYLGKKPEQIKLLDIINIMESTVKINRCLEADEFCNRKYCDKHITKKCPVRKTYTVIQDTIETQLKGVTLKDLMEE